MGHCRHEPQHCQKEQRASGELRAHSQAQKDGNIDSWVLGCRGLKGERISSPQENPQEAWLLEAWPHSQASGLSPPACVSRPFPLPCAPLSLNRAPGDMARGRRGHCLPADGGIKDILSCQVQREQEGRRMPSEKLWNVFKEGGIQSDAEVTLRHRTSDSTHTGWHR